VRESGDAGTPTVLSAPDSPAAQALSRIAETVLTAVRSAPRVGG